MVNRYFLVRTLIIIFTSQYAIESYKIRSSTLEWEREVSFALLFFVGAIITSFLMFILLKIKHSFNQTYLAIILISFIVSIINGLIALLDGRADILSIFIVLLAPTLVINLIFSHPINFCFIFLTLWLGFTYTNKLENNSKNIMNS